MSMKINGSLRPSGCTSRLQRYARVYGQRWIVHHGYLLAAGVLLGEMLGVGWEDG